MSSMHERIEIRVIDDVVCVAPSGELDLVTAPALRAALEEAASLGPPRIVLTLRDVTFLDSTALGAIVHGSRMATEQGRVLTLTAPAPSIRRVLTVTGLDHLLDGRS
jgi:anti-sigma B factor antagonist